MATGEGVRGSIEQAFEFQEDWSTRVAITSFERSGSYLSFKLTKCKWGKEDRCTKSI